MNALLHTRCMLSRMDQLELCCCHLTRTCLYWGISLENVALPRLDIGQFGTQINEDELCDVMVQAEHYLAKVLKHGTPSTTIDVLRYWQYHHSKNKTIQQLPPTSGITILHILRSLYATHVQLNCFSGSILDPCKFDF